MANRVEDWEIFDLVLRRNRITALAHRVLADAGIELPVHIERELSRRALGNARSSLAMARESILLQRALGRAGIPAMIIKGTPLAILAYGELGLKESWDIDLLTATECVSKAAAVLVELGYNDSLSHLDPSQFEAYSRLAKDAPFTHPVSGITVELHWSVTDHRRLLRSIRATGPAQDVETPAGTLRTIADDELFAYLSFHGALHSWSRLHWLADFGALIARYSEADLERLWDRSHHHGARRAASVALLLCHRLLGRSLSSEFLSCLRKDPMNRLLERNVLAILAHRGSTAEHVRYSIPWFRALAAQFVLSNGAVHAIDQARVMWSSPIDRVQTPLPARLEFLYPALRIPLWLVRKGKTVTRRLHG